MRRQLPNLISCLRFVLTPFAVRAILDGRDWTAFWLCLLAGLTDFLDGGLARALRVVSRTGAILDPLADKFMLDVLYAALWYDRGVWAGGLVIARDLLIVAGSLYIHHRTGRLDFPPSLWGKASTVAQIGWVLVALAGLPSAVVAGTMWIVVALTLISGWDYARTGIAMLKSDALLQ